jgi:hypothetical protein
MAADDEITELLRLVRWQRARDQILAALRGDPVAIAENYKEVERLRQREIAGDKES